MARKGRHKDKKGKGGDNVSTVLSLQNHIEKKSSKIRSYSIYDMILDPDKRKEAYEYYNSKYEETKEEKEIFEEWQKKIKRGDD